MSEIRKFLVKTNISARICLTYEKFSYGTLCRFYADGSTSSEEYCPNICVLNRVIDGWWQEGIAFAGIAHSHPNGVLQLSREDIAYAETIVAANPQIEALCFAVAAQRGGAWRLAFYNYSVSPKRTKDRFVVARRLYVNV